MAAAESVEGVNNPLPDTDSMTWYHDADDEEPMSVPKASTSAVSLIFIITILLLIHVCSGYAPV